jgi:competence protein ComEC
MKKYFKYILIFFITTNLFAWWIIFDFLYYTKNEVSFLSVGQGDAEFIQIPAGNILIDAGPDAKILSELDKSLSFYDKTIDLFILSHPNKDHFNGLFDILERYEVKAVMLNNLFYTDSLFQQLLQELDKRNILVIEGIAGTKVSWGKQDNLLVIYPEIMVSANQDPNKFSLVNILKLGQNCFLFTGDISSAQEKKILPLFSCVDYIEY